MPEFSLNKMYFSREKPRTDHLISALKRRNCKVKTGVVKEIIRKRQTNDDPEKEGTYYDKYDDLMVF